MEDGGPKRTAAQTSILDLPSSILDPQHHLTTSPPHHLITSPPPRPPLGQRLKSAIRGFAIEAIGHLRQPDAETTVHIARATDYNGDLADVLERQYEAFRECVPLAGKRVVLKPNLVEYHRDKVINTHPHVVAAAIELCRREGAAEVIVAEGPGHWRNVEYLVSASGLGDVLRHYKVPFVDLNHDEPVKTLNLGRLTRLDYLYLARTIASAEVLISIPKLKTHHWAGATLSLKNLFGTLPGICYGWPKNELHWRGIDNSIVDIALTRSTGPGRRGRNYRHGRRRSAQRHAQAAGRYRHGLRSAGRGCNLLPAHATGTGADRLSDAGTAKETGTAPAWRNSATWGEDRDDCPVVRHGASFPRIMPGRSA